MSRLIPAVIFLLSMSIAGCAASIPQLRTRASYDLDCNAARLQVEPIDSATEVVTGCGKRAVYVALLNNARSPTWLLNSNVESTAAASAVQSGR